MESPYVFPSHRLQPLLDPSKTPLILFTCGSYSPITYSHLRTFSMARDACYPTTPSSPYQVVGGFLSPVHDGYRKPGLAPAKHRVAMCKLAVKASDWLAVDDWEARQEGYLRTAKVLDRLDEEINGRMGGVEVAGGEPGERRRARIVFLAGSDLIQTMSQPGVWAGEDLHHILGKYGLFIIERAESEIDHSLFSTSSVHSRTPLVLYRDRITLIPQPIRNDTSSTKIRLFLRKGMSVRYLIPGSVARYIEKHGLYKDA